MVALLGLLTVACSAAPVAKTATPQPPPIPTLFRGFPEEHEIAADGKDVYELRVEGRSYLELSVDQYEVDVVVTLVGPELPLVSVDNPGAYLSEQLAVILPEAGSYRLTVAPFEPPGGRYRIKLKELRPARAEDENRAAAAKLLREGRAFRFSERLEIARALKPVQEALAQWQAAGDTSGQVRAMVELGELEQRLGHSPEATCWLANALDLADPRDEEESARAFFALGDIQPEHDTLMALENLRHATRLWKELGNANGQGRSLLRMGAIQLKLKQLDAAFDSLQQAIPLLHKARNHEEEVNAFMTLQGAYLQRGDVGDVGEALQYLDQGLKLAREWKIPAAEATALYNLSIVYRLRGELQTALRCLEQALSINQDPVYRVSILQGIGSFYHDLGEWEKAKESYEEALQLSLTQEKAASLRPGLLNNIGWIFFRQRKPEIALDKFRQALSAGYEQKDDPGATAPALHNLGVAEISQGHIQEGLDALRQALSLRRNGNPYPWAQTLRELGTAYEILGDLEQAAGNFDESLQIARRIGAPGLEAETLYRWALLDRKQGRFKEGLDKIGKAVELVESLRSRVDSEALRTSFFASKRDYYELYIDLLMHLHFFEKALAVSERARCRGLLDLLATGKIELRESITEELKRRETDLSSRLSWLLDPKFRVKGSPERSWEQEIKQTEKELSLLESEVRQQNPRYAGLRFPAFPDLKGTQQLLGEDTALVEYFIGQDSSALFVVTREGLTSYPLPPKDMISSLVEQVRGLVERPAGLDITDFRQQSFQLYQLLLGPAKDVLEHKHSLLIAADGPLYMFPFEVLLTGEGRGKPLPELPYLLRDYVVSYVPSASVLQGLRESKHGEEPGDEARAFVAFADPLSSPEAQSKPEPSATRGAADSSGQAFPRLPYSATEVEAIAKLFEPDQSKVYKGLEATKENVLGNPLVEDAQRVHFATHGYVDEVQPERSALILTPSGGKDGHLTVADIFNMKLRADLVVLSACKTALGKEVRGEGIVGLTRAFLYAGAKSLVVSLWPVIDHPTADLMRSFYHSLQTGSSKAEALQQAKREMIRNGQVDPYLWAPFILSGESR